MIKIRKEDDRRGASNDRPRRDDSRGGSDSRPRSDDNRGPRRDDSRGPRKFDNRDDKRGGPRGDKRGGPRGGGRPKRDFFGNLPEKPEGEEFVDKTAVVSEHRFNDISDLDHQVLALLEKRAFLIRKEGAWRKSRQKSMVDPQLEKLLRGSFDAKANELGLDARLSRTLFTLLNQFSLADVRKTFTGDGYKLAPRVDRIAASITGPRSFRYTRMMLAMAASSGNRVALAPATMNAQNKDLAKALKQIGAPIHWDDDEIRSEGERLIEFEGNMAFVGEEPFNFYLLLCLALAHAGRCKFTGKPALQLLDIASLNKVLPRLGARLVPMNPNNPGLPARLECGGPMDESVTLPGNIDPDFAAALTLAAWSFPGGLTIKGLNKDARERVSEAVEVLTDCGIKAELKKDTVTVSDGTPVIEDHPQLPLSVRLNSMLLALPIFCGGSISIEGHWPKNEKADRVVEELTKLGLKVTIATENIVAVMEGKAPESATITIGETEELMPLALALALKVGDARLTGSANDTTLELLDRMGAAYELGEDSIDMKPGKKAWDGTWFSPDPIWSMGCALAAYSVPGIVLENHGEVTSTWPEFWNFYNSLPTGKMKPKPIKERPDDEKRTRRVKIR